MSSIKTAIRVEEVLIFLQKNINKNINNVTSLNGGEMSQAFSFKSDGKYLVIRFYKESTSFEKDKYASEHFSSPLLPIPKTISIGKTENLYYSITEQAKGKNLDEWRPEVQKTLIPEQIAILDSIHAVEIKEKGFGWWDKNGHAKYSTWQKSLAAKMEHVEGDFVKFKKEQAKEKGDVKVVFEKMITLVPEMPNLHFLVHADYGFNNLISDGKKITGVLDWGNSVYGDFLYDVAWLDFWAPKMGYKEIFQNHFIKTGADIANYDKRILCYQLHMGLGILGFFVLSEQEDKYKLSRERVFGLF